jgi:alcohol dehydrogenase/L-iditol 2-dehydrogenase
MKALVKFGTGAADVEVRQLPIPEVVPGRVLVQPRSVGVCGSDVHMWRNHQSWEVKQDLVLGHEVAGVIVDVGAGVDDWSVGDRVVMETAASVCGRCAMCRTGRYHLCPERKGYGALCDGSMSELVLADPRVLHAIPEGVDYSAAAMTEPYCVAYNALVERGSIKPGELVVVQGVGPIGALCVQLARMQGAGTVVVLGTNRDGTRLDRVRELGADRVVNVDVTDPTDVIRGLGDGLGADVVIDATGVSIALKQAMGLVRPLGSIVKVGWGPQPLGFSLDPLVAKAVTLYGCFSHTWQTWERVLSLFASGRLDPSSVIGGEYALSDWEQAFGDMESGKNIKSVITFDSPR